MVVVWFGCFCFWVCVLRCLFTLLVCLECCFVGSLWSVLFSIVLLLVACCLLICPAWIWLFVVLNLLLIPFLCIWIVLGVCAYDVWFERFVLILLICWWFWLLLCFGGLPLFRLFLVFYVIGLNVVCYCLILCLLGWLIVWLFSYVGDILFVLLGCGLLVFISGWSCDLVCCIWCLFCVVFT